MGTYPILWNTESYQTYLGVDLIDVAQPCSPNVSLTWILCRPNNMGYCVFDSGHLSRGRKRKRRERC